MNAGNRLKEGERNSLHTRGTLRGKQNVVSLAESVDVVDFSPAQSIGGNKVKKTEFNLYLYYDNMCQFPYKAHRDCTEPCEKSEITNIGIISRKKNLLM